MDPTDPHSLEYSGDSRWTRNTAWASQSPTNSGDPARDWLAPSEEVGVTHSPQRSFNTAIPSHPLPLTHSLEQISMSPPALYPQTQALQTFCLTCGSVFFDLILKPINLGSSQSFCQRCQLQSRTSRTTSSFPREHSLQPSTSAMSDNHSVTTDPEDFHSEPVHMLHLSQPPVPSVLHSHPEKHDIQPWPTMHPSGSIDYRRWPDPATPPPTAPSALSMVGGGSLPITLPPSPYVHGTSFGFSQVTKQVGTEKNRRASGERRRSLAKFVCEVPGCDSTFTAKHNYKSHLRSHYGERPYTCKWCQQTFTRVNDCTRHEKGTCKQRPPRRA